MSSEEIIEAVKSKKIRLAYYALIDSQGKPRKLPEKKFVCLDDPTDDDKDADYARAVRAYFLNSLKADSLYFHIGPYVKVEFESRGDNRKYLRQQDKNFIFNIQNAKKLSVFPGESIVIGTNEYIELDGEIGASLYATVSKTDVGFSHISTIIDPWWEGVLQIGLTNLSKRSRTLNYLEQFCTVRFHRLEKADEMRKRREDWLHFANNYWFEENESRVVIPIREDEIVPINFWQRIFITRDEIAKIKDLLLSGLGIGAAIAVIAFFVNLKVRLDELKGISDSTSQNKLEIARLQKDLNNLSSRLIQTGEFKVAFSPNSLMTATTISFNKPLNQTPIFFVSFQGLPANQVAYSVDYANPGGTPSNKFTQANLTVKYIGNPAKASDVSGTVKWLLLSPLE